MAEEKAVFGYTETWFSEESSLKPGLSAAFNTITEAQKLSFRVVYLPPGETKATEKKKIFFLTKTEGNEC